MKRTVQTTRRLLKWLAWTSLAIVLAFSGVIGLLYWQQDRIVQELITTVNKDFNGHLEIEDSHVSPFGNFPYISIDLDHVRVFENKEHTSEPIFDVRDVYLGFDLMHLLQGQIIIKSVKLSSGSIKLVQHRDGSFNIANALSSDQETESSGEESHLDIRSITLSDIDLIKINEENNILIEAFINQAVSRFKSTPQHLLINLDSRFEMNVVVAGDSTFVKHKHFEVDTELDFNETTQVLTIQPSELKLEKALFKMDGTVDMDDDANMNINFHGYKPNFDLFLAFAPEEIAPLLQRYDNAGKIFFEASVKGKSVNGHNPMIIADFGCEDAFFNNKISQKKVDQLFFKGHFTTGALGTPATMEFRLEDFNARPEAGTFQGSLSVKNFESPDIDMKLQSKFELDFLAKFFNISDLQDLKGSVSLTMNFHDIIDLQNPERSIEKLNESYFTELDIKDLSFRTPAFHLPLKSTHGRPPGAYRQFLCKGRRLGCFVHRHHQRLACHSSSHG